MGRPVAVATFGTNAFISGEVRAREFKLVDVILHVLAAWLVFIWLSCLGLERPTTTAVACLWLFLPINVSTVLYPVQRMAQLSAVFTLLGMALYCHWRVRWQREGATVADLLGVGLILGVVWFCGVLSKENAIVLPWLLVLHEALLFRGTWRGKEISWLKSGAMFLCVAPVIGLAALPVLWPDLFLSYAERSFTLGERLMTESRVLWSYVAWSFLPLPGSLGLFHDDFLISRSLWSPFTTVLSVLAWVGVLVAAVVYRKRYPLLVFGVGVFLIAHGIESTILPLELVFEHRNYLPSVGLVLAFVLLAKAAIARVTAVSPQLLLCLYLLPLAATLCLRLWIWSDEGRLYQHSAEAHPQSVRARFVAAMQRTQIDTGAADAEPSDEVVSELLMARAELMQLRNDSPVLACAGLLLLDTRWFPGNPDEALWIDCLKAEVPTMEPDRQNRNAVRRVLERAIRTGDHIDDAIFLARALRQKAGDTLETRIALTQLRRLSGEEGVPTPTLELTAVGSTRDPRAILIALDIQASQGNPGAALDMARELYNQDRRRYLTPDLRRRLGHE